MVLPDTGPNSRKTVVSWMNETPTGICEPLRNNWVPNCCCWYWSDCCWRKGSLNRSLKWNIPPFTSRRR